ncbi:MAG: N-acetyltransferase [Phycisphaerae bacterium]|nr:N-acetyltransferase [Phycisphaerae bacterium]
MTVKIQCERLGDEDAIDRVICAAFGSPSEPGIVRVLRDTYPTFDRHYSINAWDGDELVGHTLFTPCRVRLMGATHAALAVGPVAVLPKLQRQGIGGAMMHRGHELGRAGGFDFAFLLGHPSYYPRLGYRSCFGVPKLTFDTDKLPQPTRKLQTRPVRPSDIPWLAERCFAEWQDVDFGILWGTSLSEWALPGFSTVMWWTEDNRRAGYTAARMGPHKCDLLLAEDPELALDVLATIRPPALQQHPSGWLARNVVCDTWSQTKTELHPAAMAYELRPGVLDSYIKAIEAAQRPPGACLFPLPFLVS